MPRQINNFSPNQREILYTLSTITGRAEPLLSTNGMLNISGITIDLTGSTINVGNEVEVKNDTGNPIPTTNLAQLVPSQFDYIAATYPDSTTEVYTYKTGGSSGTTVATVTVVFTTSTKDIISSVTRT